MKYSDLIADWLVDLGYTHCFFVAGGNIMHLVESLSRRMRCVATVHEVAAGVAAEYFNESRTGTGEKALALVTAGPGLTNILTAFGGAYLESRELLVLGGQVKTTDLATGGLRQRGIQEIDGVALAKPVSVLSERVEDIWDRARFEAAIGTGANGRKGPVFLEFCLDVQGRSLTEAEAEALSRSTPASEPQTVPAADLAPAIAEIAALLRQAERPVLLIGGGVSRTAMDRCLPALGRLGVPLLTTWNGMDRVPADHPLYFGRPNTWGQRPANILQQQSDLVIALGTRLGMQQTGFNWQSFAPLARVVQVDIDPAELAKGHPRVDLPVAGDADAVLDGLSALDGLPSYGPWQEFCREVTETLPLNEACNITAPGFLSPYDFCESLSDLCHGTDVVIPCSSGGAFTVMMQTFAQKKGQIIITNKGLASMGYGLSGAIGTAMAHPDRRVVLIEGDGGFAQNLQELGTVAVNALNLKVFIFANEGYASIRMTQRNYFGGRYVGCDSKTGLGLPNWSVLSQAYGIPCLELPAGFTGKEAAFTELFESAGPAVFVVPVDLEQTYFPKITSRVTASGLMESNPLHLMSPDLPEDVAARVLRHMPTAETVS